MLTASPLRRRRSPPSAVVVLATGAVVVLATGAVASLAVATIALTVVATTGVSHHAVAAGASRFAVAAGAFQFAVAAGASQFGVTGGASPLAVAANGTARLPVAIAAAPTVSAEAEATPQGVKVAIRGSGWPARATLALRLTSPPGASEPLDLGSAVANTAGDFRATKLTRCTTADAAAGRRTLTLTVQTADGAASAETRLAAAPWVCAAP
jgi:hypothetical protein